MTRTGRRGRPVLDGAETALVADTCTATTTYTDDKVVVEIPYTYRIRAINEYGVSERSRWFRIDTPACPLNAGDIWCDVGRSQLSKTTTRLSHTGSWMTLTPQATRRSRSGTTVTRSEASMSVLPAPTRASCTSRSPPICPTLTRRTWNSMWTVASAPLAFCGAGTLGGITGMNAFSEILRLLIDAHRSQVNRSHPIDLAVFG